MKRVYLLSIAMAILLCLSLAGCKQEANVIDNAIAINNAEFSHESGAIVWLYKLESGEVGVLYGNTANITMVVRADGDKQNESEQLLVGKNYYGHSPLPEERILFYVRDDIEESTKTVTTIPDFVFVANSDSLPSDIPTIKTQEELFELANRFAKQFEETTAANPDQPFPIVTIEMEDSSVIKAELYPHIAPNTVNNFISLVQQGYYDGLTFHRIIDGFMIQGGDPEGTGMGGPGYGIKGEFNMNGYFNFQTHAYGVLSMARNPQDPNSAGSQFFIMVADNRNLDGQYAAFGKLIEGSEVLDKLAKVDIKVDEEGNLTEKPVKPPVMKQVTVETFDVDYPEPEVIK